MSIEHPKELAGLREAGRVVHLALTAMREHVRPGVTTAEVNHIGEEVITRAGARSAPMLVYGFPAAVCISVNEEIVHGIPSARVIRPGDLVKLDVTVEKNGFMADAAVTVAVGPVTEEKRRLVACAEQAFFKALEVARAGNRVSQIGRMVERTVAGSGFSVVRQLCGHGIGRRIHEAPEVPNYDDPRARTRLTKGLVITIEPMVAAGSGTVVEGEDGWTLQTADGSLAAHFEHTLVITKNAPMLLTAHS